jgi:hypothetical protein
VDVVSKLLRTGKRKGMVQYYAILPIGPTAYESSGDLAHYALIVWRGACCAYSRNKFRYRASTMLLCLAHLAHEIDPWKVVCDAVHSTVL